MKIAVIGLGRMGRGIALNLLRKGYEVSGFDIDENSIKTKGDKKFYSS
ncbi:MAG: NAD(P)-binding domain-containing protein [Caldisphaera sp.]|jgi:3-hydroxyisobutyrate dehydrogenase-like beta-hydroxyacid dehydrogenase